MSKMVLHDPFGHLKHKLWPKEGSRAQVMAVVSLMNLVSLWLVHAPKVLQLCTNQLVV